MIKNITNFLTLDCFF